MLNNYWKVTTGTGVLLALSTLVFSMAVHADGECREVNILLKQALPPQTCAYDVCGASTSSAGLGKGTWESGLNFTDVAPPPAPIPQTLVLTGTATNNFIAENGDVFFGHTVFVAAPERPNISGAVYFMAGGTGKFADATAEFVDIKQRDESTLRLVGEVCGL